MAAAPIDLSAGLVQKPIDLSAGLVAKQDAPAPQSWWDKAKANFNSNTQGAQPGDGVISGALKDFGAGGGDVIRAIAHPIDMVSNMLNTPSPEIAGIASMLGDDTAAQKLAAQPDVSLSRQAGQLGTGAIVGGAAGEALGPALNAAKAGLGRAALLGNTPEGAYESAMKPSPAISSADRAAMVKTGLENELPVSKAGMQKLGDLIDDLNQKIKDTIAADPNRPIDPNAVATRADIARQKFANQVNAGGDLKAIEASKQQFLQEQGAPVGVSGTTVGPAPPMGASDAQAMKQGTYRVLSGKYGEQGSASVEAQKALARGLKEEIANQFPEINNLNQSESRLLDLQPVLERAVNRISNHQILGIGTPIAGVAAEAMTGSPGIGRVAMVLKGVLDNPNVKSRLAIAVSKSQKIPIATATSRVNAYAASIGSAAAESAGSSSDSSDQAASQPASQ